MSSIVFDYPKVDAAKGFMDVLRSYLDSLCSNLQSHTITNVQSNNDKVFYLPVLSFRIEKCVLLSSFRYVKLDIVLSFRYHFS
jgi:hypothetical protein